MASHDQHHEQRRQLVETIKKTLELQENGSIPNIIDPQILENLSRNDPGDYLEALQRTSADIRNLLSVITPQHQTNKSSTNKVENLPSERAYDQKCTTLLLPHVFPQCLFEAN